MQIVEIKVYVQQCCAQYSGRWLSGQRVYYPLYKYERTGEFCLKLYRMTEDQNLFSSRSRIYL